MTPSIPDVKTTLFLDLNHSIPSLIDLSKSTSINTSHDYLTPLITSSESGQLMQKSIKLIFKKKL